MKYSQGSVIYGIRSQYYMEQKCYGIIITARCEIAQCKAKNIHVLSALSLKDWIRFELFPRAVQQYENDLMNPLLKWAKSSGLDFETLKSFGPKKVEININFDDKLLPKQRDPLYRALNEWGKWIENSKDCNISQIDELLDGPLSKKKNSILKELMHGKFPNEFCFIPENARKEGRSKVDGLVVNLKDIMVLPVVEVEKIELTGIEKKNIMDENELCDLNRRYCLLHDDDFVMIDDDCINSPWIEHLMQNFSNAFARIGVDGASTNEILDFCNSYMMCRKEC